MTENKKAWEVFYRVCESEHTMVQIQGIDEITFNINDSDISFKVGYNNESDKFYIKRYDNDEEKAFKEDAGYENLYSWLSLINSH